MIINNNEYKKTCVCGKKHDSVTEFCVIESGALKKADYYMEEHGFLGKRTVIYDENTYEVTKELRLTSHKDVVLPPKNLHADNHAVAVALEQIPTDTDYLVAVGSGTIHDITRYCAYKMGIPFVSCPTAASVDGFCSSVAAMTWDGFKKTFTAVAPKIVIADIDIISKAPIRLAKSGFGDMVGKFIALCEWKIGHILTNEYICPSIYDITLNATKDVVDCAEGIKNGEEKAYEKLVYGLLMSGIAMQLLGYSRCASGAEHHISHIIEMEPEGLGVHSDALHGEKVGVGTLIARKKYGDIVNNKNIEFLDYEKTSDDVIKEIYGKDLCGSIIEENKNDCCVGITAEQIKDKWEKICDVVNEIPSYDTLLEKYRILGLKESFEDIGIDENMKEKIMKYSPLIRNRLTLMRLSKCFK